MAQAEEFVQLFKVADLDNDGFLTFAELSAVLKKYDYPMEDEQLMEFFKLADTSQDQRISLEEFMAAMRDAPMELHVAALVRFVFAHFDKSGDGEISREELKQAMAELGDRLPESKIDAIFTEIDKDNSGTVNLQEFMDGMQRDLI